MALAAASLELGCELSELERAAAGSQAGGG
jgi:hypothetical protein